MRKSIKILLLVLLILIFSLWGCNKTVELECRDYNSFEQILEEHNECFVFVYKDNCRYCELSHYYVNEYNSYEEKEIEIVSYNVINGLDEKIGVERYPTLLLIRDNEISVVTVGFNKIKLFLKDLLS